MANHRPPPCSQPPIETQGHTPDTMSNVLLPFHDGAYVTLSKKANAQNNERA